MHLHLHGGTVSVTAPLLASALPGALKRVLKTVNARFACIDTSIPAVKRGYGVAAALASVAAGTADHQKRIAAQVQAATEEVTAPIKQAQAMLDQADRYNALLRSISGHILHGYPVAHADADPLLAESGATLRRAFLLGDRNGLARKTANALAAEADSAAQELVKLADHLRKMNGAIKAALLRQRGLVWQHAAKSAADPNALCDDSVRKNLSDKAKAYEAVSDRFSAAYRATFYKTGHRRAPPLKSISKTRITLRKNGFVIEERTL